MPETTKSIEVSEGLVVADPTSFQNKLAEFVEAGPTGMHVVLDFDRTLTVKKPGSRDEVTTWHILRDHLPKIAEEQYTKLFEKYRTLEINGNLTTQDAVTWWSSILNLFVDNAVNLNSVEKDFLDRASIRTGVRELFEVCSKNKIPTIIFSAGIREVIDIWCRRYDIKPTLVLSTALLLDSGSNIIGWERDTLVHALNKSETKHPELHVIRKDRPMALVIGDGIDDASMATGDRDVIRVRLLDPRADELANIEEERRTFERFDALINTSSLQPLCEFVKTIIRPVSTH